MPDDVTWLLATLDHHTAFQVAFHPVAGEVGAANEGYFAVDDDQFRVHRSTMRALRSRPGQPDYWQVGEDSAGVKVAGIVLVALHQQRDLHSTVAGAAHCFGDA